MDSNHRSKLQQIYSLSPLATRESAHVFNYDTWLVYHTNVLIARYFLRLPKINHNFPFQYFDYMAAGLTMRMDIVTR